MQTILVSYYTSEQYYTKCAKRLIKYCTELGIKYNIKSLPTTGNWLQNTRLKPTFILDILQELQCRILYVDIDSVIYGVPNLVDTLNVDIAARKLNHNIRCISVGTIFCNNTLGCMTVLKQWKEECRNDTILQNKFGDHTALSRIWGKNILINYGYLPDNYCAYASDIGTPIIKPEASHKGRG